MSAMGTPSVVTEPVAEPITLAEAKEHLRVVYSDDDLQISLMITAARQSAEQYLQRALMPQTLQVVSDGFANCLQGYQTGMQLPWPPFAGNVEIVYTDADGNSANVLPENLLTDYRSGLAVLRPVYGSQWPAIQPGSQVRVQYAAGYAAAASVPAPIKAWMLLLIGTLYENRESTVVGTGINAAELPGGIWDRLVQPYRVYL